MQDLPPNFGLRRLRGALEKIPGRGIAIDIGAHKGIWTKVLMTEFERVYSFEPIKDNFDTLIQINPDSFHVAIGDHFGTCSFKGGGNTGQYHISEFVGKHLIYPLDYYNFEGVDFIKIDVEGYENHVLIGARDTIKSNRPAILLEDNGLSSRYDVTSDDITKTLDSFGYEKVANFQDDDLWLYSQ